MQFAKTTCRKGVGDLESLSFWRATAPLTVPTEELLPSHTDVVVIGAGLSGLSIARRLAVAGRDVVVVDQRGIGGGASARNGGIVAPGLVDGMVRGITQYGPAPAQTLLKMSWQSVDLIREAAQRASFPVELELSGHLTLARDDIELARLRDEAHRLAEVGETATVVDEMGVPATLRGTFIGGLWYQGGFVHSGRLTQAFAELAVESGVRLYAPLTVRGIERDGRLYHVEGEGGSIAAQEVVVATNGFTRQLLPTVPIVPQRGQMMVTQPTDPVLTQAMSARHGFDYFHQRRDGRLVIGGYRDLDFSAEATDEMVLNNLIQDALTRLGNAIAGHPVEVEWRWSCIMGFTDDHLPLAGQLQEGLYLCAGFSGHGVVMAPIVGRMVAEAMLGAAPSALSLFQPTRALRPAPPDPPTPQ